MSCLCIPRDPDYPCDGHQKSYIYEHIYFGKAGQKLVLLDVTKCNMITSVLIKGGVDKGIG